MSRVPGRIKDQGLQIAGPGAIGDGGGQGRTLGALGQPEGCVFDITAHVDLPATADDGRAHREVAVRRMGISRSPLRVLLELANRLIQGARHHPVPLRI